MTFPRAYFDSNWKNTSCLVHHLSGCAILEAKAQSRYLQDVWLFVDMTSDRYLFKDHVHLDSVFLGTEDRNIHRPGRNFDVDDKEDDDWNMGVNPGNFSSLTQVMIFGAAEEGQSILADQNDFGVQQKRGQPATCTPAPGPFDC